MASLLLKPYSFISSSERICKKIFGNRYMFIASKLRVPTTVDTEELTKFDSKASEWWNSKRYNLLHSFNSVRVPYVRDGILSLVGSYKKVSHPLTGYHILDIGCGGGILSEPLARLGAYVTGLDPGSQNIEIATEHALKDPEINERINYVCDTVENLAASDVRFDSVIASEVIEHVNDVQTFVHSCVELTKSNGSLFFTTFNKTKMSYFLSILMAEYVLGLIPKGTHEWNKFVRPEDLTQILESMNCRIISVQGIMYNPVTMKFSWCKNNENWYALHAVKE